MDQTQALQDILESVQFLRDHAVSKEDAEAFATKEDLKAFATKEDLKAFATKEDLKAFATKEDVQEIVDEAKRDLMTTLDALVVLHKKLEVEIVADRSNYRRIARQVEFIAKHLNLSLDGVV